MRVLNLPVLDELKLMQQKAQNYSSMNRQDEKPRGSRPSIKLAPLDMLSELRKTQSSTNQQQLPTITIPPTKINLQSNQGQPTGVKRKPSDNYNSDFLGPTGFSTKSNFIKTFRRKMRQCDSQILPNLSPQSSINQLSKGLDSSGLLVPKRHQSTSKIQHIQADTPREYKNFGLCI